jgi:hypothetical protein
MSRFTVALAGLCLGLSSTTAFAQQASSSGYALGANENVSAGGAITATVNVGPLAQSSGSAPPSYSNSNSVASVSQNASLTTGALGVTQSLQTGILTSSASGTATGAQATATVNDLQLSLAESQLLTSLLGLSATTIQSSSQANSVGGLDASGSTTIEGLTLSGALLGGLSIDGSLFINPAPNTVLFSIAGLSIILNEQTLLGDGVTTIGISTNAIDVAFSSFPFGTSLANGNIIIGHSEAMASLGQAAAVPEPGTWAMMLLGFGGIGLVLRRRRNARQMQFA